MEIFIYTLLWNLVISISILSIIYFIRFFKSKIKKNIDYITSITIWVILWVIFLWFFPEILDEADLNSSYFWLFILLWLLSFYFLELFFHWHHCRDLSHNWHCHCDHNHALHKEHMKWKLMFLWTFLHNSIHWIVLFGAFSINVEIWIVTTIAILLHSIPQNISNYIMTDAKSKYYIITSFWWVFGAILTLPFIDFLLLNKSYIILFICGWLLYTALTDILPEIKNNENVKSKIIYFFFLVFWIILFSIFNESIHLLELSEH